MVRSLILTLLLGLAVFSAAPAQAQQVITFNPSPYLFLGRTLTLTATVIGRGPHSVQWLKDNAPLGGPITYTNTSTLTRNGGPVQASDAGDYGLRLNNPDGTITTSPIARLTVVEPIQFTTHPGEVTVRVGGSASFTATATGPGELRYQWYQDDFGGGLGFAVPGETSPTLTLNNLPAYTMRFYYLEARNAYHAVRSGYGSLTVLSPPGFRAAPVVLTYGSIVPQFGINPGPIAGTLPMTFRWEKDGVVVNPSARVVVSREGVLVISDASDADSGEYRLIVTNEYGSATSSPVRFTYTAAPKLLPVGVGSGIGTLQQVIAGGTATFLVAATGSPAPTFQWKYNGVPIAGATSTTYVITNVTAAHAGDYTVTVSNPIGSVTSYASLLIVTAAPAPPTILSQGNDVILDAGRSVSFSVSASGAGPVSYQWYFNGSPIAGATGQFYTIGNVKAVHEGLYHVVVTNPIGSAASKPVRLTVIPPSAPPTIFQQPQDLIANLGGNALFVVSTIGTGIDYQWLKNGAPIAGETTPVLSFFGLKAADAGRYSVEVSNSLGKVTSRVATLTLTTGLPVITSHPPNNPRAPTGYEISLYVSATGAGLSYQWQRDGVDIPGATEATLTFRAVQASDAGTYHVFVSNPVGTVKSNAATLQIIPPTVPIPTTRLANLSVRARLANGEDGLVVGFVSRGSGGKQILLRGVGPSLRQFGINDSAASTVLSLFAADGRLVSRNTGWFPEWANVFARAGAFPYVPDSQDTAIWIDTDSGAHTAILGSTTSAGGVVLAELYDLNAQGYPGRFINLSARAHTEAGNGSLVAGFVITGTGQQKVLVRGIGPTLSQFGVTGAVARPRLELRDSAAASATILASNAGWGGSDTLRTAFAAVGAFALQTDSNDAALLVTLPPGAYTATLTNENGTAGVALLEVYDVP